MDVLGHSASEAKTVLVLGLAPQQYVLQTKGYKFVYNSDGYHLGSHRAPVLWAFIRSTPKKARCCSFSTHASSVLSPLLQGTLQSLTTPN